MRHLIRLITLRHLLGGGWRTLLLLLGIGLGVAVYVSTDIAVGTAIDAFKATIDAVAGKTQIQVSGEVCSLDEELFLSMKRLPFVEAAAPVVESVGLIEVEPGEPVLFLGIDIFSDRAFRGYRFINPQNGISDLEDFLVTPCSIIVSEDLARKYRLRAGDTLPITIGSRSIRFRVNSILAGTGPARALDGAFAIIDIAAAQEILDKVGRLDRIDLILKKDVPIDAGLARIRSILPPGVKAEPSDLRNTRVETMVGSYALNLLAFSLIAFLVAAFLVYSSMSFSVARRQREIGLLRALGSGRGEIRNLFLMEGVFYGLAGGLLGSIIGILVAKITFGVVARSISSLYLLVKVRELDLSASTFIKGFAVSLFISVLAAFYPAREASNVNPRDAFDMERLKAGNSGSKTRLFAGAVGFLAGAVVLAFQRPVMGKPLFGFASAFFVIFGVSLFVPVFASGAISVLRPLLNRGRWSDADLSLSYVSRSLRRTAVPMAALVTVITMVIGVVIMVTSFRRTVEAWVDQGISGDLFVSPALLYTARHEAYLPGKIVTGLNRNPDIKDVYLHRHLRFDYRGHPATITAGNIEALNRHGRISFKDGDSRETLGLVAAGKGIIVTETFSETHKIKRGGRISLLTPSGTIVFPVLGVFYDYRTDGGGIWMDRSVFIRYWKDDRVDSLRLYLHDKTHTSEVQRRIKQAYGAKYRLFVFSHQDLKKRVLDIFDQTFSITYVFEIIALFAATLGMANTFLILIMERRHDIGVYRAIGATRRNIVKLI
ncbi:MAG: FtsX-like permease family protein, partial [Pseudomonadota bacterium]